MRARALVLVACGMIAACQGQGGETGAAAPQDPVPTAAAAAASPEVAARVEKQQRILAAACKAGETPVFTCKFADGKRVSVCGTAPGKAEFRFGGEGKPELVLSGGRNAYAMYSGGGESQLAFDNGDTRYIVFSRMVRTGFDENGNAPAISDGVVVERAGTFAAIRICEDPDLLPVDVYAAEKHFPASDASGGADLFTEETIRADPQANE